MANVIAKYQKTILAPGKKGIIKPDDNGYYHMTLGAFDAFNEAGILYPFNEYLKREFKANSHLMRRLKNGNLGSEVDHPEFKVGMTMKAYLNRLLDIRKKHLCGHIADLSLLEDKDHEGRKIIRVDGRVAPSGVHAHVLERGFSNPEENVNFSVRSIVAQRTDAKTGLTTKNIKQLVTWDYVNEPGIRKANKFMSPGLESMVDGFEITPELLLSVESQPEYAGLESGTGIDTTMIRTNLGWEKVQLIKPSSINW